MKQIVPAFALLSLLTACGGGGSDQNNAIEGTWRGDVLQGVILCSDGTSIGAGGGSVIREVALIVSGTDEVGTPVQATDGDCFLEGVRDNTGFRASSISGCDEALTSIQFTLLEDGSAALSYDLDIDKVPAGPTGIRCAPTPQAQIRR